MNFKIFRSLLTLIIFKRNCVHIGNSIKVLLIACMVVNGVEAVVAKDSGATVVCKADGIVDSVDANRIVVRSKAEHAANAGVEIYRLSKFRCSNQNTDRKSVV